ncbi:hypothetical protein SKAU_G00300430 [Synaphobranchus kaupii]|uniref:PDZ domain-containing protein n=1 Tax=Synaphobranchus kaupii TaxID=118154 RepID=A0A9Q1IL33_SYNKA|nr:hypothetical protein SKAU_G00300430 [Synaphobranchus kaupii]
MPQTAMGLPAGQPAAVSAITVRILHQPGGRLSALRISTLLVKPGSDRAHRGEEGPAAARTRVPRSGGEAGAGAADGALFPDSATWRGRRRATASTCTARRPDRASTSGPWTRARRPTRAGLRPQDRLIEVNGVNIESLRHSEVVAFIKSRGEDTRLLVVDPDTDEQFKKLGIVPTESHIKDYEAQPETNGSPSLQVNGSSTSQSTQSTHSELSTPETSMQAPEEIECPLLDPFEESGLRLSPTAAEAKEKAHAKRARKRAPQMDWNKKHELFSNF